MTASQPFHVLGMVSVAGSGIGRRWIPAIPSLVTFSWEPIERMNRRKIQPWPSIQGNR